MERVQKSHGSPSKVTISPIIKCSVCVSNFAFTSAFSSGIRSRSPSAPKGVSAMPSSSYLDICGHPAHAAFQSSFQVSFRESLTANLAGNVTSCRKYQGLVELLSSSRSLGHYLSHNYVAHVLPYFNLYLRYIPGFFRDRKTNYLQLLALTSKYPRLCCFYTNKQNFRCCALLPAIIFINTT